MARKTDPAQLAGAATVVGVAGFALWKTVGFALGAVSTVASLAVPVGLGIGALWVGSKIIQRRKGD